MNEHTKYLIKRLHTVFDSEQKERRSGGFGVPKSFNSIDDTLYGQVIEELQGLSDENENLKQKLHGGNLVSEKSDDVCGDGELLQLVRQVNTLLENLSSKVDSNPSIEYEPLTTETKFHYGVGGEMDPYRNQRPAYIYVKQHEVTEVISPEKIIM